MDTGIHLHPTLDNTLLGMDSTTTQAIVYSSMGQCSAATGISKRVLRLAKSKGCDGFIGSRVNWTLAKPWIDAHLPTLTEDAEDSFQKWRTKREKHEANIAEIKEEKEKGKYLLKEEVESQIKSLALAQKAVLKAKLTQELPSKLLGLSVTEMSVLLETCLEECCKLMEGLKIK